MQPEPWIIENDDPRSILLDADRNAWEILVVTFETAVRMKSMIWHSGFIAMPDC